ncbi:YfiT family bacillithiol transferase [Mucilaginibacter polytrichastri]|uniref:Putative metal-dependent hydrolase n=1 Tax=Mucilaginibacter polytrichastri TaxID=1302689 RepID=A0A1Q6A516_9SPHI|nr:putative metal-dependent hydrolase [Mucilaginibacter polytrichastri]OKS89096.1 Putative metal-dependent hydrolase [Mucilaginibacter polytrichastri]SFS96460.1 DinB superfamily protein [Mucilaginibacter polytrichastri]
MIDDSLRYPIGKFTPPAAYTQEDITAWIADIKALPMQVRNAVIGLTDLQLNTPYRPGGWTIKQVVHHMADSHMNSLIRFKWALTEENPTIKTYHEDKWATQPDYALPVESSLKMLEGIHQHLVALLESFSEAEWNRTFYHPEAQIEISLKRNLGIYSWHGRHHLAHIQNTQF